MNPASPEQIADAQLKALLDKRAERLAAPLAWEAEDRVFWAAEFTLGDELFAIPLEALRSAMPLRFVTPVPLSPAHIVGIVRFEGQILAVQSLSALLGGRGWKADPSVLLVVDAGFSQPCAVDCEQIPRAVGLPFDEIDRARRQGEGVIKEVSVDGKTVHLIDVNRLFDRRESARRGA